jgi:hypothetical protein
MFWFHAIDLRAKAKGIREFAADIVKPCGS